MFSVEKMKELYPDKSFCLYGEGYGARIQKGGGNYISTGVDFVLFDLLIQSPTGDWWLKREDMEEVAKKLSIHVVPIVITGTVYEAIEKVRSGFTSTWSKPSMGLTFLAEGLVGKTKVELEMRNRDRIITKLKTKDFLRNR